MSTRKFTGRVFFTETDLTTLKQLISHHAEQADAKIKRFNDPREKAFYRDVKTRLESFNATLESSPEGEHLFSESDLRWLSSIALREQRSIQSRFNEARANGLREAIKLGGLLERLYSLNYQISLPLDKRARAVARALKLEEAAAEQAKAEELARKQALRMKKHAPKRQFSSNNRPRPKPRAATPFFPDLAPKPENQSEQLAALADLFK